MSPACPHHTARTSLGRKTTRIMSRTSFQWRHFCHLSRAKSFLSTVSKERNYQLLRRKFQTIWQKLSRKKLTMNSSWRNQIGSLAGRRPHPQTRTSKRMTAQSSASRIVLRSPRRWWVPQSEILRLIRSQLKAASSIDRRTTCMMSQFQ